MYLDVEVHICILFTVELLVNKADFFEAWINIELKVFPFQGIVHEFAILKHSHIIDEKGKLA